MKSFTFWKEWARGAWRDPAQFFQKRKPRICSACGYKGIFVSAKRRGSREFRCPNCASRPRDRQIGLILSTLGLTFEGKRILHFAPEWWLFRRLNGQKGYVGGDIIQRRNANAKVDITNIDFPDESFDVIVCNHVLEHVEDDARAMRECARVLAPDGIAIFTVPTRPDRIETWEPPEDMSKKEIEKICGWDHKRLYGLDIVKRLQAVGFATGIIWFNAEQNERYRFFNEPVFLASKNLKSS
jgi:SAM-dependent methyltransferase